MYSNRAVEQWTKLGTKAVIVVISKLKNLLERYETLRDWLIQCGAPSLATHRDNCKHNHIHKHTDNLQNKHIHTHAHRHEFASTHTHTSMIHKEIQVKEVLSLPETSRKRLTSKSPRYARETRTIIHLRHPARCIPPAAATRTRRDAPHMATPCLLSLRSPYKAGEPRDTSPASYNRFFPAQRHVCSVRELECRSGERGSTWQ